MDRIDGLLTPSAAADEDDFNSFFDAEISSMV